MTRTIAVALFALTACTTTSAVMPAEDGTYLISAAGSYAAGGTTGANNAAFTEATRFCGAQGAHPVVVNIQERDVHAAAGGFGWQNGTGWGGGASMPMGNANMRFRCVN